ncbi:hypothetical protein V9N49_001743 [Vibrio cholerae]
MHKLQNGSQVSVRPERKPLVGLGGYFSESNDQGAPSYPGQDWFNDCTDEFINALDEMGITYDQEQLDHLARAFAAVRSQEWNANVNYGIGQEVVRNNQRYIARAASGPDNGGAVAPQKRNNGVWDEVIPSAFTIDNFSLDGDTFVMIATCGESDSVFLSVLGGTDFGAPTRFSADIVFGNRSSAGSVTILPKTLSTYPNPSFYTRINETTNLIELWMERKTTYSCPLTIIKQSGSLLESTNAGVLSKTNIEPSGLTLVPYDTGYQYASIPIGMEVAFDTPPPTNDPRFRFVKLTHNDAYNTGLLTSQTLSGSAPELVSTAVISAEQSPINGQTISLINTMGTFIRPGVISGVRQLSTNKFLSSETASLDSGLFATALVYSLAEQESRPYNESRVFYKRIY